MKYKHQGLWASGGKTADKKIGFIIGEGEKIATSK